MGRVEHCSRPAILRAFTASNPESLVISKAVFNIISFVILAFGGIRSPFNQDIYNICYITIVTQYAQFVNSYFSENCADFRQQRSLYSIWFVAVAVYLV